MNIDYDTATLVFEYRTLVWNYDFQPDWHSKQALRDFVAANPAIPALSDALKKEEANGLG